MAYYTYSSVNHVLYEVSDVELPTPSDGSCTEVPGVSKAQLLANYTWNPDTHAFDIKPITRVLTKLEYMNRFTDAELALIYTEAKTNVVVEIWLEKFKLASDIYLDDQRTVSGVQMLEQLNLIAAGRVAEILA
jgi:hypothetical protein